MPTQELPVDDVDDSVSCEAQVRERAQKELCNMYFSTGLTQKAEHMMAVAFPHVRQTVMSETSVKEIIDLWPFLGVPKVLLQHYKQLTGEDIESVLYHAVQIESQVIYDYSMISKSSVEVKKITSDITQAVQSFGQQALHDGFFLMLMTFPKDDANKLVQFFEVTVSETSYATF